MIKSISLFTYELDNPAIAVEELSAGLKGFELLKNTIGILMCDPDYVNAGIYGAVAKALPFPVAGATTMTQAVNGEAGSLMLTLMVLSSDDVYFEAGMTGVIASGGDIVEPARAAYKAAAAKLPEKPKLIIAFPPLFAETAGDAYIDAFESLCPGVPVFGTLAVDDSITFQNCSALYGGEHSLEKMSFILVAGNVSPRFLIATISDDNKLPYTGEITKSVGNVVQEVNDVRTSEYFESIGYAKDGKLDEGIQFIPYLLDFKKRADYDGIPVIRAMVYFDENGYGICRGNMYQNSVFTLTNPTSDDVLKTSVELMQKLESVKNCQALLIFSCVVRRMSFGVKPLTEAEMISDKLSGGAPFMLAYAGGEICPTSYNESGVTNRFHNYSIIALVL
jgi:hypothetical protein